MSIFPHDPWGAARKVILCVGSGWPVAGLIAGVWQSDDLVWMFITAGLMAVFFGAPALILSAVLLPTYKSRIVAVPPFLIILFWAVSSQSADYNGFQLPPYLILWFTTCTAVTLLLPEAKRSLP